MSQTSDQLHSTLQQLESRSHYDPSTSLERALICEQQAREDGANALRVRALLVIARSYNDLNQYRKGLKYIKEIYNCTSENDDKLPQILHLHARLLFGRKKYYSALQLWISALEQSSLIGNTVYMIKSLAGIADVWCITCGPALAAPTHELAARIANKHLLHALEGQIRLSLAWDHYQLNDYIKMLSELDNTEELLTHTQNNFLHTKLADFRTLALLALDRFDEAEAISARINDHHVPDIDTHLYLSRARHALRQNYSDTALSHLRRAEKAALKTNNNELLGLIYRHQSEIAEHKNNYQEAYKAYKKFRHFAEKELKARKRWMGSDKAHQSRRQIDQRAQQLISRLYNQYDYNLEKHFSNFVSETYWWEQLIQFKSQLSHSEHAVIMIQQDNPAYLEVCTELLHSISTPKDLIARLTENRLVMLISENRESTGTLFQALEKMIAIYPWQRKNLMPDNVHAELIDILSFPFTLEQLEDTSRSAFDGKPA